MNRREFMNSLREELSKLPPEERDAAVEYYEEYFDEAGWENEQEVIDQLGSPKKVAGQIKSEYAVRLFDETEKPSARKGLSAVWYVIIGICSAPVSIPFALCLGILAITIFIAVICCIIGVFAGLIGAAIGSLACVIVGIMAIPVALSTAVLMIGVGLGGLGVMAAMTALLFIGVRAAVKAMMRSVRKRNERKKIEQMVRVNESKKWRYTDKIEEEIGSEKSFEESGGQNQREPNCSEPNCSESNQSEPEKNAEDKAVKDSEGSAENGGEDNE